VLKPAAHAAAMADGSAPAHWNNCTAWPLLIRTKRELVIGAHLDAPTGPGWRPPLRRLRLRREKGEDIDRQEVEALK
jgi:hypothetical protein